MFKEHNLLIGVMRYGIDYDDAVYFIRTASQLRHMILEEIDLQHQLIGDCFKWKGIS